MNSIPAPWSAATPAAAANYIYSGITCTCINIVQPAGSSSNSSSFSFCMQTFSPVEDKNMPQLVWGPDQVTQAAGAKEILSTLRSSAAAPRRRRFPSVFRCSNSSSNNNNIQLHDPPAAAAQGRRSYCFAPKPSKVGLTGPIIKVGLTGPIEMGRVLSRAAVPGPAAGPGAAAAAAAAPGPAGISCCSCASKLRWF